MRDFSTRPALNEDRKWDDLPDARDLCPEAFSLSLDERPAGPCEVRTPRRNSVWKEVVVPVLMFVLTALCTLLAGAFQRGVAPDALFSQPLALLVGLPYSLTLLLILGAHEMGHYVASRK